VTGAILLLAGLLSLWTNPLPASLAAKYLGLGAFLMGSMLFRHIVPALIGFFIVIIVLKAVDLWWVPWWQPGLLIGSGMMLLEAGFSYLVPSLRRHLSRPARQRSNT